MTKVQMTAEAGSAMYGDEFYGSHFSASYRSAQVYAALLTKVYQPQSMVDFGCGRGAWLKAFGEHGVKRLVGFDGPWNNQANMFDQRIEFQGQDLNGIEPVADGGERFDLAMTVEVCEHLQPDRSAAVVEALCSRADVVMFGSAFLHQSGVNHINLRLHSFWAQLFADNGYAVYDYFRPETWGREDVCYWYQQNTFLYVRKDHALNGVLAAAGHAPVTRLALLDAVHPELLMVMAGESGVNRMKREMRDYLKAHLPESVVTSIRKSR